MSVLSMRLFNDFDFAQISDKYHLEPLDSVSLYRIKRDIQMEIDAAILSGTPYFFEVKPDVFEQVSGVRLEADRINVGRLNIIPIHMNCINVHPI